jgi:PAS domain S-box-containing protein
VDTEATVRPEEWASALAIVEKRAVSNQFLRIQRFDSGSAFVNNSAAPILNEHGEVSGCAVAIMDVTAHVEAELAVARAKQEWERTFDAVPDLIAVLDDQYRIVRANRALAERLATTPEECVGQTCYTCVHDLDVPHPECPHVLTLADGREHTAELHEERLGGDFLVSTTPLVDENGKAIGSVHVARDITARKQRERELQQLNRTLRALSDSNQAMLQASTEPELVAEVCRIIIEECGHTMAWIGMAEDDEGKGVRPVAHAGRDDGYIATLNITWADTERGRGPTGTAIRTGKTARCNDMVTDPAFTPWREEALKRGYRSSLVVPVLGAERPLGALTIYSDKPNAFGDEEVSLLSELAGDLAFGIRAIRQREARADAERALRHSEHRYRALVELSPDAVFVNRDDTIVYANAATVELFGATDAGQVIGKPMLEFFHPDFHATIRERVSRVLGGTRVPLLEEKVVRLDGSLGEVEVAASRVEMPEGPAVQVLLHDVTERKRAEAALRTALEGSIRRGVEIAALLNAARTALESRSFEEASLAIIESCKAAVEAPVGIVALFSGEGTTSTFVQTGPEECERVLGAAAAMRPNPLLERALNSREAKHDNAFGPVHDPDRGPEGRGRLGSVLFAPLAIGPEVAGVLAFGNKKGGFTEDDCRLAMAFAEMASVALFNSRALEILEAQVQERTRQLESERARLFALLEELPLYVFLRAPDSTVTFANRYFREHFGDPTGRRCYELMGSGNSPCEGCMVAAVLETETPASWEWASPDGRSYQIHNYPFKEADGTKLVLELGIDVTELRRAVQAEQRARQAADTLRETSLALTRSLDIDTVLLSLLEHLKRLVPFDRAKVMLVGADGRVAVRAILEADSSVQVPLDPPPRFEPGDNPVIQRILTTREATVIADIHREDPFGHKVDPAFEHSWLGVPLVARGTCVGVYSLSKSEPGFFTVEHRRLAEALSAQAAVAIQNALLFQQVEDARGRMQGFSRRLVEVQEVERQALARELHDEASQSLTSLLFGLRLLEKGCTGDEPALAKIAELKSTTDGVMDDLHRLAANLRPASLEHLGFVGAMRQHIARIQSTSGIEAQFLARGLEEGHLSTVVETTLFRVVQEALTNVLRHAHAQRVDVLAERRGDRVMAIVEDDGVGFDPYSPGSGERLGLVGMRERAEALGGTLTIESSPGAGTTVVVEVPYVDTSPDRG